MNEQYDGWIKSSHRSVAVCNDCHVPHNLIAKYATKGSNGFHEPVVAAMGTPVHAGSRDRIPSSASWS